MNGKLQPFQRGIIQATFEQFCTGLGKNAAELTPEESKYYREGFDKVMNDEVWINDEYQVNIERDLLGFNGSVIFAHLSIKRRDKKEIHDWRDLQEIKNRLMGPEYEGIEIYPSEKRVVDTCNQYHLWVATGYPGSDGIPAIPLGWEGERQVSGQSYGTLVQRPLE